MSMCVCTALPQWTKAMKMYFLLMLSPLQVQGSFVPWNGGASHLSPHMPLWLPWKNCHGESLLSTMKSFCLTTALAKRITRPNPTSKGWRHLIPARAQRAHSQWVLHCVAIKNNSTQTDFSTWANHLQRIK